MHVVHVFSLANCIMVNEFGRCAGGINKRVNLILALNG